MTTQQPNFGFISITDKLPAPGQEVEAYVEYGFNVNPWHPSFGCTAAIERTSFDGKVFERETQGDARITHWRPAHPMNTKPEHPAVCSAQLDLNLEG